MERATDLKKYRLYYLRKLFLYNSLRNQYKILMAFMDTEPDNLYQLEKTVLSRDDSKI